MATWYCEKCPENKHEDCGEWLEDGNLFCNVKKMHEKHKGWQKGKPKESLKDGVKVDTTIPISKDSDSKNNIVPSDSSMFCTAHGFLADDNSKQIRHENNNNNCLWEKYDPKTHSVQLVKAGIRKEKLHFVSVNGEKRISKDVLDYKIRTLRPITYFKSENTKMILVYLPTKKVIEKIRTTKDDEFVISTEIQWVNSAYFMVSNTDLNGNKTRKIIPYDDELLKENYRINVLPEWNDVRWDITDCKNWLDDKDTILNPKELYALMDETARIYLEYDEIEYAKFNLWDISTYFYDLFTAFPYYDFTGTKRAGKTKSLEFQNHTCYNAIMSPDVTGPSLFRIIEGIGATVLLDEAEEFKNKKNDQAQAVRNLLMQGFLKDQYAIRSDTTKDKNFTPTQYNIYSPKALAHINSFDDVLEERCLRHNMKRGLSESIKNTWISEKDPRFQLIRNGCYRLFLDHADQIYDLQEEAMTTLGISGRELQLWTPIMTLALFFEKFGVEGLVNNILTNMQESKENRQLSDEEESRDLKVLDYLSHFGVELATNKKNEDAHNAEGWMAIGNLYNSFKLIMTETYQLREEYFTRRTLSQTLERFGFKKEKKQDGISFLITENTVNDAKMRMGISDYEDTSTDNNKITSFTSESSDSNLKLLQTTKDEKFRNNNNSSESSENKIESSDDKLHSSRESEVNEQNEVNEHNTETPTSNSFTCQDCNITWKYDKRPIEEIQAQHSMSNENHTVILLQEEQAQKEYFDGRDNGRDSGGDKPVSESISQPISEISTPENTLEDVVEIKPNNSFSETPQETTSNSDESLTTLTTKPLSNFACQNCLKTWKDSDIPIKEIQTLHSMSYDNHTVVQVDEDELP